MEIQLLSSRLFIEYSGVRRYLAEGEEVVVAPPRGILGKLFRFVAWWKRLAGFAHEVYPDHVGVQALVLDMQYSPTTYGSSIALDGLHKLAVDAGDMTQPLAIGYPVPEVWDWIRDEKSDGAVVREIVVPAAEVWMGGLVFSPTGRRTWAIGTPSNAYVAAMLQNRTPQRTRPEWGVLTSSNNKLTKLPVHVWDATPDVVPVPYRAWWQSLKLRAEGGLFVRRSLGYLDWQPW